MSPALCSASHRSPAGLLTVELEEGGGRPCWGRWQVVSGHHPSAPPLALMECLWGLSWDTEIPLPTSSERPGGNGLANRPVVTCMDHAHLPIHLFSLNPESSQSVWQGAQTGGCRSCPRPSSDTVNWPHILLLSQGTEPGTACRALPSKQPLSRPADPLLPLGRKPSLGGVGHSCRGQCHSTPPAAASEECLGRQESWLLVLIHSTHIQRALAPGWALFQMLGTWRCG